MSRRNRKDVDDLLADLDNLGTEQPAKPPRKSADKNASLTSNDGSGVGLKNAPEDAQSLLDDLDSLVQSRAATSSRASLRTKKEEAAAPASPRVAATPPIAEAEPASSAATHASSATASSTEKTGQDASFPTSSSGGGGGGWAGWGSSIFSQATKLADQARQEFEKRAPTQAEHAREFGSKGWDLAKGVRGFVKETGLEKWGE